MLFAIYGFDKEEGGPALRAAHIEDHRAYAGAIRDRFAFGGPLQTDDGSRTVGSLIVVDFPDRKSVEEWFAQDPLNKAGVYASINIRRFQNRWPQRAGFVPEK
jgi:uncharacterized protein YciI